ncbi:MAG TPA: phospholipase D-like domain-containing protein [Myxococcaceae bacterium]
MARTRSTSPSDGHEGDWLDVALARAAGAAPVSGNRIRLLRDGPENFPAWLEAIASARSYVYFETYIFRGDRTGQQFAEALSARAREGIKVRVVFDWTGSFATPSRIWRSMREAGVEVRSFNPFDWSSPLGWVHRDHRKTVSVDGRVAFVSGLCVGDAWAGDPANGIPPWRDTGVQIEGPAVADVEQAFARVWATMGTPLSEGERRHRTDMGTVGDTRLRVISDEPGTAGLLRLDQFIASAARRSLWITDAYFAGTPPYVQALRAAALDGVDIRLLVPGSSDIPALQPFSRAGFRALLEAGIRVFEWKGPMLHAKTAVCDGQWARVGSTNLNVASWLSNYELDVALEDARFAGQMEEMFLGDLENSTELVLSGRRMRSAVPRPQSQRLPRRMRGSAGRAAAGALRVGNTVGAAISERRTLEGGERRMVFSGGLALLVIAVLWALFPRVLAVPVTVALGWLGLSLLWKAWRLRKPGATTSPASLPTTLDGEVGVPPPSSTRSGELRTDVPS